MQTALLSAGIAVILALVTALVGPLFVDWGAYRSEFEARVAALTGLEVRVTGPIDLRLLPTPTLTLRQLELGRPGDSAKTRARALRIEFALGDLLRGEWRAPDMRLRGPELTLNLDQSGHLAWSAPTIGLDPDAVSIDHLEIEGGHATLADAASGSHLQLDDLTFAGQVRSLAGPVKGEGSFTISGQRYPFRLSVAKPAEDGGVKVRLNLEPADLPRTIDVDGSIWVERGIPRFEGALQVARTVSRGAEGSAPSWRLSSHIRADRTAAVLDQLDLQYGPDDRALRFKGDARLSFGAAPELSATLSASQLDLDRLEALPEATERRPLAALKALAEALARTPRLAIPVTLGISADTVTIAGTMLQRVGGDVKSDGEAWDIQNFTFRAPGLTQAGFSGRLTSAPGGVAFEGATRIDSSDPRTFVGWLADRSNGPPASSGPLHFASDIAYGGDKIVFDRLQAELDRMKVEGHVDYAWPRGDQPAKLNVALRAPELDLDRVQALLQASLGDTASAWPREGTLALDLGHATMAGVDATDVAVKLRHEAGILDIDHLAIGDIGGAKLSANGRIDAHGQAPRGALALDLDARSLDGVATLVDKLSPAAADRIRRAAPRAVPAKLHASLALDRSGAAGANAAKLKLQGNAGMFRLDLQGDASGGDLASTDWTKLGGTTLHLNGLLDSNDGSALIDLLGLDRAVAVNQRSGRISIELSGPIDGDLNLKSQILAGGLDVTANGTVHPSGSRGPIAQLMLRASAADVLPLRSAVARRGVQAPWSTLTARLAVADDTVTLSDANGTLAGSAIKGDLGVGLAEPHKVSGNISIAALDLATVLGATLGFPHANAGGDAVWPADPFDPGLLGPVAGQVTIRATQVALTPKLNAHDLHAVVDLDSARLAVADLDGTLAGGRIGGDFAFERGDDGITMHSHLRLADGDAAELLGGGPRPAVSGKLTAELELAGAGRSPIALIGSLQGSGKFSLRNGSLARLDPAAFDVVTRAVDQGLPIDTTRIGDRMDAALAVGGLPVSLAEGTIAAAMGQLRLVDPVVQAKGAAFSLGGSIDLTQQAVDAHLVLSVPKGAESAGENRPDVSVDLKGPIGAPKRSLNVAPLTRWLALRLVEEKARRVDALEQAAREHAVDGSEGAASPAEREPVTPAAPANPVAPPAPPRFVRPNPPAAAAGGQDTGNAGTKSDEPRPRRSASGADVPVPTDIRPPAQRAPRPDNAAKPQPARPTNSFLGPLAPLFGQ